MSELRVVPPVWALTAGAAPMSRRAFGPDYGPLHPVKDQTTGLELISLPKGFEYISYGWTGDPMTDGRPTPGSPTSWGVSSKH